MMKNTIATMHEPMQEDALQNVHANPLGCDRWSHQTSEHAVVLPFLACPCAPSMMCEMVYGFMDVSTCEACVVTAEMESMLLDWEPDDQWWAGPMVMFAVDGVSTLCICTGGLPPSSK